MVLELVDQRSLGIALRALAETLGSLNLATCQLHAFLERGQHVAILVILLVVIGRLAVNLDEAVELDDLAGGDEFTAYSANVYLHRCLLQLSVGHL